jgi:anti-sigma regulatory factor (Ser/Thr protein kinase)
MQESLRVPALTDEVRKVCAFIANVARGAGMADWAVFHCELAVEEAFVNIAEYGFAEYEPDNLRDHSYVDIAAEVDGESITITICDNSPPFNPLEMKDPNITKNIQQIETGGLGIHFYKKLMDQVHYEYRNGENRLTLRKLQDA